MRWKGGRRSGNVQDRRGRGGLIAGGGVGAVLLTVIALMLGVDPDQVAVQEGVGPGTEQGTVAPGEFRGVDEQADFVTVVLGYTEDVWHELFQRQDMTYREPQLVMFDDRVSSACGMAGAAVGPFYCPPDHSVYIDLAFFRELEQRFGAPGDFAQAYVIAHEVGHHVQTLLGVADRVRAAQAQATQAQANALQVEMELQADCFAGVWAFHTQREHDVLDPGDIEEALGAAAAIGDDRLQRQTQGTVVPESFTHGTSAQRMQAFRTGFETGDPNRCGS